MLQLVPHLRDDCSSGWSFVNVWRLVARGAPVGGRTPVGRSDVELRCECAGAGVVKRAVQAVRLASMAYGTTVQYQPVRQIRPLLGWEACGDLTFNGLGVRRAARPIRTPAQSTGHTTIFTRLSVVCALSTVATSNSKGFEKFSAHFGCGISSHNTAYS